MIKIGSKYKFNAERWNKDFPEDIRDEAEIVIAVEDNGSIFKGHPVRRHKFQTIFYCNYYTKYFDLVEE